MKQTEKMELDKLYIIIFAVMSFFVVSLLEVAAICLVQKLGLSQWFILSVKIALSVVLLIFLARIFIVAKNGIGRINKDIEKLNNEKSDQ